ncbi:MAG: PEGA domain-containing protein [Candidatus Staskawiczbacteria bacterium]|jgi:hypothetical protein
MTKKTRLIILLVCVACFLIVAPVLVLYSMGYRFDFEKMKITATGGIYVRTFPAADKITIDSNISEKPGIFANSIFVQSLLPKNHTISIKKDGYYDYFKTLPVQEKQVTKLENVLLFKKNIQFSVVADKTQSPFVNQEKFIIKNNNLYYSNIAANSTLTAVQKATPVLKGLAAFSVSGNNIIWLGTDGFLYQSDLTALSAKPTKLTLTALKINKKNSYKIVAGSQNIFLIINTNLLFLNAKTNSLDNFYSPVADAKISPDGKNIVYFNDNNIYVSTLLATPAKKSVLYNSSEKISDVLWLNNDYIIFTDGDKIIISEIDYRGNINAITLPTTITISPNKKNNILSPQIFFNQQSGQLYILTSNTLLLSEKITP